MNTVANLIDIADNLTAQGVTPKLTKLQSAIHKKTYTRKTQRKTTTVMNTNVNYDSVTPKRNMSAIRSTYAAQVKADRIAAAKDRQ